MPGKTGKRKVNYNRELVKCSVCQKELQKDNFNAHKEKFHRDEPSAKFIVINDSKQPKLNFATKKKDDDSQVEDPSSELKDKTVEPGEGSSGIVLNISQEEEDQLWNTGISPGITPPGSPSRDDLDIFLASSKLEIVSRNPGFENNNEVSTTAIAGSSSAATSVSDNMIDQEQVTPRSCLEEGGRSIRYFGVKVKPWPAAASDVEDGETSKENELEDNFDVDLEEGETSKQHKLEDNLGKSENICPEPEKEGSGRREKEKPSQPLLRSYAPYHDGQNKRDFQKEWYNKNPWLQFDETSKSATCFACIKFGKDTSWKFTTWKNSNALGRHSESSSHKNAMTKWISFLSAKKSNTSVLKQINSQHIQQVAENRAYAKSIFETVAFLAKQGLAFRGDAENRENLTQLYEKNRGNFLELLCLRSQDSPILKQKLPEPVKNLNVKGRGHGWLTSDKSQNEMVQILQDAIVTGIIEELKSGATDDGEYFYSVIVDESSDMSNHEQFSLSLSSVNKEGKKSEDFVKLIKVPRTDGEYLFETLVKNLEELGLDTAACVSLAGDGASNISGHEKGLAARLKEVAPLCVYVHCYAHRLNLAVKDLLSSIQLLRNVLGTVQEIYNFLEGSPKRSEIFKTADIDEEDNVNVTTLKNQGATRWAAKGDSVIAVSKELKRVVKVLDCLTRDKDAKVSAKAKSILRNIYGEEFVFGVSLLESLLIPVNKLSNYLQGRSVDMRKARENVKLYITTFEGLKNEESFNELWQLSQQKSTELKLFVEEDDSLDINFDFDEAKVPRRLKWTKSPKEYFRVTHYEAALDKIVTDLNIRFMDKDKNVILDLVAVVNDDKVAEEVFENVGKVYSINAEELKSEHRMFQHFKVIKYF